MPDADTTPLDARIADVVSRFDDVEAAYLFGSRAENRGRAASDVDIGIVHRADRPSVLKLDLLEALTRAGFDRIDLVLLNDASPVLRFEVVRPNRLVFARPDFDHPSYYSLALRMHEDEVHLLRWQRAALKERLQRAQT